MNKEYILCERCKGRKKIYKVLGGYSYVNTGGILIECDICSGIGKIESNEIVKNKKNKILHKDKDKDTTDINTESDKEIIDG